MGIIYIYIIYIYNPYINGLIINGFHWFFFIPSKWSYGPCKNWWWEAHLWIHLFRAETKIYTPWKLTWNPKSLKVWFRWFPFKQVIFRFHINFPGCRVCSFVDFLGGGARALCTPHKNTNKKRRPLKLLRGEFLACRTNKPFRPFVRGTTSVRDLLTMVTHH